MSDDEKLRQVGGAVADYQDAKTEYAHVDEKLRRVLAAYRTLGELARSGIGQPEEIPFKGDRLYLSRDPAAIPLLMNETELTALMVERSEAHLRVKDARELLTSLGYGGIQ